MRGLKYAKLLHEAQADMGCITPAVAVAAAAAAVVAVFGSILWECYGNCFSAHTVFWRFGNAMVNVAGPTLCFGTSDVIHPSPLVRNELSAWYHQLP